jgi:hypothetical protein
MRELNVNEIEQVNGGVWTPTTTFWDSPTAKSDLERLHELMMFLATVQ